jgi:hypothetical protein
MKLNSLVSVITSDGNELEPEVIEALDKRHAAVKAWVEMNCYGVETIFVRNQWDAHDRAVYQQVGSSLQEQ